MTEDSRDRRGTRPLIKNDWELRSKFLMGRWL